MPNRPATPDAGIERLREGNRRFVEDRAQATIHSALRVELASGQNPFAVILGCSDSRVPIETIFDEAPGNLFVIRVAGNVVNDDGLASIEYALEVLGATLVIVLGHSSCGAVQAAIQYVDTGTVFPGHIQQLAERIAPAARAIVHADGERFDRAVAENVRLNLAAVLARSPIVRAGVERGKVKVTGAVYDLHSGFVTFSG